MTLKEFKQVAKVEEINTNNAWGFGGWYGKQYNYKKLGSFIGKYCYRHTGTSKREAYQLNGATINKDEFLGLLNTLK